jgi:hypothetical protein
MTKINEKTHLKEMREILKASKKPFKIVSIMDFKGKNSTLVINCKTHGGSDTWLNPWYPNFQKLKTAKSCLKCSGKYSYSKEEQISIINQEKFKDNLHEVIDIIDYKNQYSRCIVNCKEHGCGNTWEKPWIPTIKDLKNDYGCPKCYGNYNYTKKEIIQSVSTILQDTSLTLIDISDYKNRGSHCHIKCDLHGNGWEWENKWTPIIKTLKNNIGCPKCAVETNKLNSLIRNPIHFNKERYIYFIKFTHNDNSFYKIGINNSENINIRYPKGRLEKNNLKMEVLEHKKVTNTEALLTEFHILRKFKENNVYQLILKESGMDGATECFNKDILSLNNISLGYLIEESSSNAECLVKDLSITDSERKYFLNNIEVNTEYSCLES